MSMQRSNARLLAVAGVLALTTLAASCGDSDDARSITLYSGRSEDLLSPLVTKFTEETGIDVEVKYGQSPDLALLLDEELAAGREEVDVFLSQSPGALGYLENNERLAPLGDGILDLVPAAVRDANGEWVGVTGRQRVLVYNTELVDQADLPISVLDLTVSRWDGKIGLAPANASFQDFVSLMRLDVGDAATALWLNDIAAGGAVAYENNNAVVEAVARGEIEVGLVNHYYNVRRLGEAPDSPSANHYLAPDDPGSALIVSGVAKVAGSDAGDAADEFIAFLLSEESQRYFADETFEYPLRTGVAPRNDIPVIEFADVSGMDFSGLGDELDSTRQMIVEAGLAG